MNVLFEQKDTTGIYSLLNGDRGVYEAKIKELDAIYNKMPKTKCIKCPGKNKVEADCCEAFSPPMVLVEFFNVLNTIGDMSEEEEKDLRYRCFEAMLNDNLAKPCTLLYGTKCGAYSARPFSCRMFGLYAQIEWDERLKRLSAELGIPENQVPFHKQCNQVKVKKKSKKITREKSDNLFGRACMLDVDLFYNKETGKELVFESRTYLPFHIHYLLMKIGPDKLDDIASMRLKLDETKQGKLDPEEYEKEKKKVEEFLEELKKTIFTGENNNA